MSYELVLSPKAEETLAGLEPPVAAAVESHLLRLAGSPTSMSRPAVLPYPPGSQMSEFSMMHDGRLHRLTILFRYGSDEQTLHVIAIGHIRYAAPPPE
jgi:hypothetical protein